MSQQGQEPQPEYLLEGMKRKPGPRKKIMLYTFPVERVDEKDSHKIGRKIVASYDNKTKLWTIDYGGAQWTPTKSVSAREFSDIVTAGAEVWLPTTEEQNMWQTEQAERQVIERKLARKNRKQQQEQEQEQEQEGPQ